MAIETIKGVYYPEPINAAYTAIVMTTGGIPSVGNIFSIPKSGEIKSIVIGHSAVTSGTPVSLTVEYLNPATGYPFDWETPAPIHPNATVVYTPTEVNHQEVNFPGTFMVNRGDVVGVVARVIDTAATYSFNYRRVSSAVSMSQPTSIVLSAAGSPSKNAAVFDMFFGYSDDTYPYITNVIPPDTIGTTGNYNINTVAFNETGMEFILPFDLMIEGIWVSVPLSASNSYDVILYDEEDNVIETMNRQIMFGQPGSTPQAVYFTKDYLLKAGVTYRVGVKAVTTTNMSCRTLDYTPKYVSTLTGSDYFKYIQRKDNNPWQYTANRRYMGGLIVSGVQRNGILGEYYIMQNGVLQRL